MHPVKLYADLAHDDIVELFFNLGIYSSDQRENRALFDRLHAIVWNRMHQLEERLREDLCRELAHHLAAERTRQMDRLRKVSLC